MKQEGSRENLAPQCVSPIDSTQDTLIDAPCADYVTRLKQRIAEANAGQFATDEEMANFFLSHSDHN